MRDQPHHGSGGQDARASSGQMDPTDPGVETSCRYGGRTIGLLEPLPGSRRPGRGVRAVALGGVTADGPASVVVRAAAGGAERKISTAPTALATLVPIDA